MRAPDGRGANHIDFGTKGQSVSEFRTFERTGTRGASSLSDLTRFTRRPPLVGRRGGARQAGQRARSTAQFRHPSSRERRRHPHHPGLARSWESVDDRAIRASPRSSHQQYDESPGL